MNSIIENLRLELKRNSDERTRLSGERFFKEEVRLYGVKSAEMNKISREHFKSIPDKSKHNIFLLCEELWQSGMLEESGVACNWSYMVRKGYEPSDFNLFDRWVRNYVSNWAACDTFCNHTVGTLVEMYPDCLSGLKIWAGSEKRWVKRASAVTLIVPAKKGMFLEDVFEIADILLSDPDDMVQKGYGWMLKVASQAHLKEVFDYVMLRKDNMPRTALRYAIEKMPPDMRTMAMERQKLT